MAEGGQPSIIYHIDKVETLTVVQEQTVEKTSAESPKAGGQAEEEHVEDDGSGKVDLDKVPGSEYQDSEVKDEDTGITWFRNGRFGMYVKKPLHTGAMVYRGVQNTMFNCKRDVAIKLVEFHEKNRTEIDLLMKLQHPNIVQIIDAGDHLGDLHHWIYIVMELCSKNLQNYIDENKHKPRDFEKLFSFSKQLAAGLAYLHRSKVIHRDLKPENVLLSSCKNYIKLSDFGMSKEIQESRSMATVTTIGAGSEGYRSPETYQEGTQISPHLDIFPLGLIFHFLFTNGQHPFGSDPYDWRDNIRKNKNLDLSQIPEFEEPNTTKKNQLLELLHRMLQHEPRDRPTAEEVKNDSFFKDRHGSEADNPSDTERVIEELEEQASCLMEKRDFEKATKVLHEVCNYEGSNKLEASLKVVECELHLQRGQEHDSMERVREFISTSRTLPTVGSPEILEMAKKSHENEQYVRSLILLHIYHELHDTEEVSADEAVEWIKDLSWSIKGNTKPLIEADEVSRDIGIKYGLEFMERLLHELRSVKNVDPEVRALNEAYCLIYITRICSIAGEYRRILHFGIDGIDVLEKQFGADVSNCANYATILGKVGIAYEESGENSLAEKYFAGAIEGFKKAEDLTEDERREKISRITNHLQRVRSKIEISEEH